MHYGRQIVLINSAGFAVKNLDSLTVGKVLGALSLGIYSFATKFGLFGSTTLSTPIAQVLFPTYSKIQGEPDRIKNGYLRTIFPVSLVAFPVCVATLIIPDLLVSYLLGPAWEPVVAPMRILGVSGLLATLAGPSWNVFLALGRPELGSYCVIIELITVSALVLPGAAYGGLAGVAVAVTIAISACSAFQVVEAGRLLGISPDREARVVGPAAIGSAAMGAVLLAMRPILPPSFLGFIVLVFVAGLCFVVVTQLVSNGRLGQQVTEVLRALRKHPA